MDFTTHPIIEKIANILKANTPDGAHTYAGYRRGALGSHGVAIVIASSDHKINGIGMQYPDVVSLNLDLESLLLESQHFGGSGGTRVLCKPNLEDPREKYCAYGRLKVPFRKPKQTEEAVLKAVERFASRWTQTLKDNRERLAYSEYVDYNELLGEQ